MISLNKIWRCSHCGQTVEANFRRCWNCGTDQQGNLDPAFVSEAPPEQNQRPVKNRPVIGFIWMLLWMAVCLAILLVATLLDNILNIQWQLRIAGVCGLFIAGLLLGVTVNVMAKLYLVLNEYLYPIDQSLVQMGELDQADNRPDEIGKTFGERH